MSIMQIILITGFILIAIGLWGLLTRRNIFKIIIAFAILDTAVHLIIVGIGYIKNRTAPIYDGTISKSEGLTVMVDPIPQALVLTAIVIGLAITALMLTYAIKLNKSKKSIVIDDFKENKW